MDEDKWIDVEWLCEQTNEQIEKAKWKGKADSKFPILFFFFIYIDYICLFIILPHILRCSVNFILASQHSMVFDCV